MTGKNPLYVGYAVGRWTVIEQHAAVDGLRAWVCRCDCWTTRVVQEYIGYSEDSVESEQ